MFVLPNLFTLCSIFCGFYAITLCLAPREPDRIYPAALAIFVGMVLDLFDGRVARLTKTQSEFGRQLDSLADLVSFGTAPAILLHSWSLQTIGWPGVLVAFAYVACGAVRLARFNVLSTRGPSGPDAPDVSVGLPIPPAAGAVVALVMSLHPYRPEALGATLGVAAGALILGGLMISGVRYRTFKDLRATRATLQAIAALVIIYGAVAYAFSLPVALAAIFLSYVALGLGEEVWRRISVRVVRAPARESSGFRRAEPNNS